MLERKILHNLSAWKNNPDRMCLMIKGARQVGKSTTIQEFCKKNYKYFIEMNFIANEEYKEIFAGNLEKENILKQITLYFPTAEFIPNETVIFLDEIQDCPRAITALKFLAQDKRFDVITSGSILGITYKRDKKKQPPSVPVGYVEHLEMHSLDFEEFLWANKIRKETIAEIKAFYDQKTPVLPAMHTKMLELFREYIVVGGMPHVVQNFVDTHNFGNVLKLQRDILEDYKKDIAKYAEGIEKVKVRDCFVSIPNHLAKKYKKFQWTIVEKHGSARKYKDSIMWLIDAGMVEKCNNLAIPELPLAGNVKDGEFKIYMRDTGLLVAMLEDGSQKNVINGDLGIYKGALYENVVADIFRKSGKHLFYFARDNRFEIDFVVRVDDVATAVEVKAGDNTKAWSVVTMVGRYGMKRAVKLSTKNVGVDGKIETLPLYMSIFI
ncbi:MAG: AAA family ATPase [Candidatus Bathyarchaeota archaeon]|nr:AAA family ATPase [Candidatus Termiticorpusculum sp.]